MQNNSPAARFNVAAMRKLQKALEADPEVDLITALPMGYAERLADRKIPEGNATPFYSKLSKLIHSEKQDAAPDPESKEAQVPAPVPVPKGPLEIVHTPSASVRSALSANGKIFNNFTNPELAGALARILRKGDVLWRSETSGEKFVVKVCPEAVVKVDKNFTDFTEYTTLQYLESHKPDFPAPRPLGLLTSETTAYIFMSFVPGVTLEHAWHDLQSSEKEAIAKDIDKLFNNLRQLTLPDGMPLGGTAGEGCKDARRHVKVKKTPINTSAQFWDFQVSDARHGTQIYLEFLRRLTRPCRESVCVFTHGDLRTANILVQLGDDDRWRVTGIIDWEMSGFYPEEFECTKVTNCLAIDETSDWYHYLPPCVSPSRYALAWLSDLAWDRHVI